MFRLLSIPRMGSSESGRALGMAEARGGFVFEEVAPPGILYTYIQDIRLGGCAPPLRVMLHLRTQGS